MFRRRGQRCTYRVTLKHMLIHRRHSIIQDEYCGIEEAKCLRYSLTKRVQVHRKINSVEWKRLDLVKPIYDTKKLLQSKLIPGGHLANICFQYLQILQMRNLAWMRVDHKKTGHIEICADYKEAEKWNKAGLEHYATCGLSFLRIKKKQLNSEDYCIMDVMVDRFNMEESMKGAITDAFTG